jgi:hypothetical protein
MKRSYVIGIIFLIASKLSFAMNPASGKSGVYSCANEGETIIARVSFLNTAAEAKIDGPDFSFLNLEPEDIKVINSEDILAIQLSLDGGGQFAQLNIYKDTEYAVNPNVLYGRLLVAGKRSPEGLEGYNLTCRHVKNF